MSADDDLPLPYEDALPEMQAKARAQRAKNEARRQADAKMYRDNFERGRENMLKNDFAQSSFDATTNVKQLTYHVTMTEGGLAPAAADAQERANKEYRRGLRNYSTNYKMGPAKVTINLYGRDANIHVGSEDVLAFEFATSGNPIKVLSGQDVGYFTCNVYDYVTVVVDAVKRDRGIQTKARIGALARTHYWEENGLPFRHGSLIGSSRQVQGLSEPRHYPFPVGRFGHEKTPTIFGHCYDPEDSFEGAYYLSTLMPTEYYFRWPLSMEGGLNSGRDVDYDLPWWYSEDAGTETIAHFPLPNTDWPRSGGMQEVDSQWGKRRFGIMISATDKVTVFPVGAVEYSAPTWTWDTQTVPAGSVQSLSPTYPAWVWRGNSDFMKAADTFQATDATEGHGMGLEDWKINHNQHRWNFSHDGKKAASVMFQHLPFENDDAFFAERADLHTPWTSVQFAELCGTMGSAWGGAYRRADAEPRSFVAPGVVELRFTIAVTGPELEDFTATCDVVTVRAPTEINYPTVQVGYAWRDMTCNGTKIKKGHMLALSLMLYTRCGRKVDGKHELDAIDNTSLWVLHDVTADNGMVFSILSDVKNYARTMLMKSDISSCSFIFNMQWRRIYPSGQGVLQPAILPIVLGVPQTLIFPETMDEENKGVLRGMVNLNGYTTISLVRNPDYAFQPMNQPYDSYSETTVTGIRNLRDVWAFDWQSSLYDWYVFPVDTSARYNYYLYDGQLRYKNDPTDFGAHEPVINAAGEEMMGELYTVMWKQWRVCMFATAPKFGWHMYGYLLYDLLMTNQWVSFGVHAPSGTWALWTNILLYDKNGLPYQWNGYAYENAYRTPTLATYDPALIEHWIVDRVHIEFQTEGKATGSLDTTFMAEYNRAVRAAKDATDPDLRLKGDIQEMTLADQRATFTKEESTRVFYPGATRMLALKCTWNGKTGYLHDELVHSDPTAGITAGGWGALLNPTLSGWWVAEQNRGTTIIPIEFAMHGVWCQDDPAEWHVRFYDPTVIMNRD
jgi:hypothetical protein